MMKMLVEKTAKILANEFEVWEEEGAIFAKKEEWIFVQLIPMDKYTLKTRGIKETS